MTADTERQSGALMRQAQEGDQQAYADLLRRLAAVARAYVHARSGDVPWADDVVQETLIAIHRARHTYDASRPFAPWFYAIVSSRLIDVVRRERRVARRELSVRVEPAAASDWRDRQAIDPQALRAAVALLPTRQRQVVMQTKFEDRSVREVADRLRMSQSAVKVTAHRAYRTLRRLLRGPNER